MLLLTYYARVITTCKLEALFVAPSELVTRSESHRPFSTVVVFGTFVRLSFPVQRAIALVKRFTALVLIQSLAVPLDLYTFILYTAPLHAAAFATETATFVIVHELPLVFLKYIP